MSRPEKRRKICIRPAVYFFKPAGIPLKDLSEIELSLDELEAVRLADLSGLYHDEAAVRMKVSRPTFGRILKSGRMKIADSLINGKAISIPKSVPDNLTGRFYNCRRCGEKRLSPDCPVCINKGGTSNENSSSE